jgi:8-oxo-dGTP pyrophosphatase MutT (NUDIX family)
MVPRQAASLILVRDAARGLELLLVQRGPTQRVMASFWVFPGGAVDEGEQPRAAAVRELGEEAGIDGVTPDSLVAFSRWITPELIAARFDTHFFIARTPAGARPHVDGAECVDWRWTTPRGALDAHAGGKLALVFPTLRQLEALAPFATVEGLLHHARGLKVKPVLPRVVGGDAPRIVLPGDPDY